ncbi:MAG: HEAT repeat domain-containing protein [Armatimonadota bacterium]
MDETKATPYDQRIAKLDSNWEEAKAEFVTGNLDELIEKSASENPVLRDMVVQSLADYDPEPRIRSVLIRLIEDPVPGIRISAAHGLADYEDAEVREALINHLRNDDSKFVRSTCASSLHHIGGANDEIIKALSDADAGVRTSAVCALRDLMCTNALPHITQLLDDPDWNVRYNVCLSMMNLGVSNDRVIETLTAFRGIPKACEALRQFAEFPIIMKVCESFSDEFHAFDARTPISERLDALRALHGEDAIPHLPQDPIGDMIDRAKEIAGKL